MYNELSHVFVSNQKEESISIQRVKQAFRFMVGPGHCPMISNYGPSLFKAVGPVDPSFLVVKISHINKKYLSYSESMDSKKQFLITNGSLMKVRGIAECLPLEHSAILLTCIQQ